MNKVYWRYTKELQGIDQLISNLNGRRGWLIEMIRVMEEEKETTPGLIKISDHAVVRFIERVENLTFSSKKDLYDQILPPALEEQMILGGSAAYEHPMGVRLLLKDNTIVTTLGKEMDFKGDLNNSLSKITI